MNQQFTVVFEIGDRIFVGQGDFLYALDGAVQEMEGLLGLPDETIEVVRATEVEED